MGTICGSGSATAADTVEVVEQAIDDARPRLGETRPTLGLLFVSPVHDLARALRAARKRLAGIDWLGCTTAGEITELGLTQGGVSTFLIGWGDASHRLDAVRPLQGAANGIAGELAARCAALLEGERGAGRTHLASLLLGDGLHPGFEALIAEIRRVVPGHQTLVGAGAGDDGALARTFVGTFVGTGESALEGGVTALHVASSRGWGVGIGQGVTPSSARMTVTRSVGNVVYELDEQPALAVFAEYARARGDAFDPAAPGAYLVQNELGIYFFDDIVRVRAGIGLTADGGVRYAGEVPEGASVAVVRGEPLGLIAAARGAAERARAALDGPAAGVLLFSCVTRGTILGERYPEEIRAIVDVFGRGVPLAGFLSYGEVARVKDKLDGYHNHTVVVAAIPE